MSVVEEFVESEDRRTLFLHSRHPEAARAVLALVHEPGSDGARYWRFARTLAAHGIASYALDLRGCGRSPGAHHRREPLRAYMCDVRAMMARVRQRDPALPLFLLGQGRSAVLACQYALRHEDVLGGIICEGIVLHPPWVESLRERLSPFAGTFRRLAAALSGSVAPPPPRRTFADLAVPLLLLHGSDDRTAPVSGSEYLHGHVASGDRTLLVFEDHGHDLVDGPGHALVQDRICRWIEAQSSAGSDHRRIGIEYINE
jgi:alpha-beta hydrolase superfamily lysophospholipase